MNMQTDFNLSKKTKIALLISFSPLFLIFIISAIISSINANKGNIECFYQKQYSELDFSGLIIKKDLDSDNHMYPFIDVQDSTKHISHIFIIFKQETLWDNLNVKDKIIKRPGSLDFKITRDSISFNISTNFDCKKDDFWIDF
jgi:hypothetical protein